VGVGGGGGGGGGGGLPPPPKPPIPNPQLIFFQKLFKFDYIISK